MAGERVREKGRRGRGEGERWKGGSKKQDSSGDDKNCLGNIQPLKMPGKLDR